MPNTIITITLEIPEEISQRVAQQGTTIAEVVRQRLEEYAAEELSEEQRPQKQNPEKDRVRPRRGLKLSEFDRNWRPTPAEFEQSLATLAEAQELAEEIRRKRPAGVSAVDAIRADRREL